MWLYPSPSPDGRRQRELCGSVSSWAASNRPFLLCSTAGSRDSSLTKEEDRGLEASHNTVEIVDFMRDTVTQLLFLLAQSKSCPMYGGLRTTPEDVHARRRSDFSASIMDRGWISLKMKKLDSISDAGRLSHLFEHTFHVQGPWGSIE